MASNRTLVMLAASACGSAAQSCLAAVHQSTSPALLQSRVFTHQHPLSWSGSHVTSRLCGQRGTSIAALFSHCTRPFSSDTIPEMIPCHHMLPPGIQGLVAQKVRKSVTCPAIIGDSCDINHDGWDSTLVRGAKIKFSDSAQLKLRRRATVQWAPGSPSQVLLVKKPRDAAATRALQQIAAWLSAQGCRPLVERAVQHSECAQLDAYDPDSHEVDFCITLGGDGTVLHLASLFERDTPLPPVVSFAMGTLGFLTPFDVVHFERCLARVLNSAQHPLYCTLRTRKRCEMRSESGEVLCVHNVLNEVVIDRGAFPNAVLLEVYVDGHFVTSIEADGLIMATPSGSTAYSMSAGGPVVVPSVPCTILTPIAPLSLSFRPLVLPESSDVVIRLPLASRSYARCSFDGKKPLRMRRESTLHVSTSLCPLPMINLQGLDSDWYDSITHKLKWNASIRQLSSEKAVGTGLPNIPLYRRSIDIAESIDEPTEDEEDLPTKGSSSFSSVDATTV